jgi:hypothetical protein
MLGDFDSPERSRLDLARYLVERGASADIFLAAALGLTNLALALVDADPSVLELRTSQGAYAEQPPSSYHIYAWTIGPNLTPLQTAARFGRGETVDALRRVAPIEPRFLLACHQGDRDAALALVSAYPGLVESLGTADKRALADEAWAANAPAVELMMELGFDPTVISSNGGAGATALHCAAWEGSARSVAAILRHPARAQLVRTRDATHHGTPLGWCCHGSLHCGRRGAEHAEVARLLIGAGANPEPEMEASPAVQAVLASAGGAAVEP